MSSLSQATAETIEPSSAVYIGHAKEANKIAGNLLQLQIPVAERRVQGITGKFSIGLSLQAGELAGKAMLRSLGFSAKQIRNDHKRHNLPTLLNKVQGEARRRMDGGETALSPFTKFMCTTIVIDGNPYGNTIGDYFKRHFSKGPSAFPRNYFYPDFPVFTYPVPPHALHKITDDLIEFAERLDAIVITFNNSPSA